MGNFVSRRPPAAIARQLRQEAGFGCCKCGNPIIQYHHILSWADEVHFRPEDMMVLCPTCHDMATKGAMPEEVQRELKRNPRNIRDGRVKGILAVYQKYCAVRVGSMFLVGEGPFLQIDGNDLLELYLGDGNLELSLKLYSEQSDLLLEIVRNEWILGDPLPWDIKADWQIITIRERKGQVSLTLDARTIPTTLYAQFWYNRKYIKCTNTSVEIGTNKVTLQALAVVGGPLAIERDTVHVGKGPDAKIVVQSNERERLWKAKEEWERVKRLRSKAVRESCPQRLT